MQYLRAIALSAAAFRLAAGHAHAHYPAGGDQLPLTELEGAPQTWLEKYGKQIDQPFSGPLAFSHLPYTRCLEDESERFDVAILGMPFDTGVSYRPGARFGPYAIRSGSRRQREARGYTMSWGNNPYAHGAKIVDCGDIPISPFDNALAVDQMEVAYSTLLSRPTVAKSGLNKRMALGGVDHPRIVSLGGDHTIVLPILRSLYKKYGPISVIHFDAHLDTWPGYPGDITEQSKVTHGTFFYLAQSEGLISNTSIHAGIRCKLGGLADLENDEAVGFQLITTDDIDDLGIPEIIRRIRERVGTSPVYLSLDIDVIDPGIAPATGTPEAGGWTTRELKRILRGLAGLNFVGADLVEVSPAYDFAEVTAIAAADLVHDFLSMFLSEKPPKSRGRRVPPKDEL
ncbi:arginase family-domain-containing protein [Mycena belliarum]|uniref:Arginase family-domain-containing protein n=1 Tax=Mycena belliarum TaxID=1033014 RepID=A0AAD6TLW8_9AGAR|nr:arginase family-domain-containing protein [Mycena belliae]